MEHEAGTSRAARNRALSDPQSLIRLFHSPLPLTETGAVLSPQQRQALWVEDSAHRAKNLSQLAAALAVVRPPTPAPDYLARMTNASQALADAYAELAEEQPQEAVPCAALLVEIAEGLVALFGHRTRPVGISCVVSEQWLSSQARRALLLIASELVVNALKYAFPEKDGTILVTLGSFADHVALKVQDDGVGLAAASGTGSGTRLLDELAAILHARIERTQLPGGGLCVSLRMPPSATAS